MGRKPIDKERVDDPQVKHAWISDLTTVYLQNGLLRFTMDEIATKLGISKATLYKYFSSKEEILDEVVRYKIQDIEAFESHLTDDQITFSERYFEVIKTASMMLAQISNQFLAEAKLKHPELWEKVREFHERALVVAEKFYQQGIDAGIMNDINPRLLALTDKMFIRSVSDHKFLEEHQITLQEAFDGYFTMKSRGIFKDPKQV